MKKNDIKQIELGLLLNEIYKTYGYDFRDYAMASLNRRISNFMSKKRISNISELLDEILCDKKFFELLVYNISITVTEMFRDPHFYKVIRNRIIPSLKRLPLIKIWHAGCATGEEVYSLAIILKEEGIYDRCRIYATDFNDQALEKAEEGIFSIKSIKNNTANYIDSDGKKSLSYYYYLEYDSVIINRDLKKNIIFSNHNLSTDSVFAEIDLIFCRNVMIYFNRNLQERVLNLFYDTLASNGILCMGSKESLKFFNIYNNFIEISRPEKIYMKTMEK